jgi:hypothetical protein
MLDIVASPVVISWNLLEKALGIEKNPVLILWDFLKVPLEFLSQYF